MFKLLQLLTYWEDVCGESENLGNSKVLFVGRLILLGSAAILLLVIFFAYILPAISDWVNDKRREKQKVKETEQLLDYHFDLSQNTLNEQVKSLVEELIDFYAVDYQLFEKIYFQLKETIIKFFFHPGEVTINMKTYYMLDDMMDRINFYIPQDKELKIWGAHLVNSLQVYAMQNPFKFTSKTELNYFTALQSVDKRTNLCCIYLKIWQSLFENIYFNYCDYYIQLKDGPNIKKHRYYYDNCCEKICLTAVKKIFEEVEKDQIVVLDI